MRDKEGDGAKGSPMEGRTWDVEDAAMLKVLSAVLNADQHAVFLVDAALQIKVANDRAVRLRQQRELFRYEGDRLAGRTNRINFELAQTARRVFHARADAGGVCFPAPGKARFTFELLKLERVDDPLLLVRVYEGYAAPDGSTSGLAVAQRPSHRIHRRLSADRKHGPAQAERRIELPPWPLIRAFEAYARLGSLTAAGAELNADHKAIRRRIRVLELLTNRALIEGSGGTLRLTVSGRKIARALADGLDTFEAALRPRPLGKTRGRPTPAPSPAADAHERDDVPGPEAPDSAG